MRLHEWMVQIPVWVKIWGPPICEQAPLIDQTRKFFMEHRTWYGELNQLGHLRLVGENGVYKGWMHVPSCEIHLR